MPSAGIEPLPRHGNACPSKGGQVTTVQKSQCRRPVQQLLTIRRDLQRYGGFHSKLGAGPRIRAVSPAGAPKRCACPGEEEGGTPGAKRAGGRNPTLKRESPNFQRSEEGSTTGHQTYGGTSPKETGGVCATASGQRRREPGQGKHSPGGEHMQKEMSWCRWRR